MYTADPSTTWLPTRLAARMSALRAHATPRVYRRTLGVLGKLSPHGLDVIEIAWTPDGLCVSDQNREAHLYVVDPDLQTADDVADDPRAPLYVAFVTRARERFHPHAFVSLFDAVRAFCDGE